MVEAKQLRVRNVGINPNRVYAPSPYRPVAIFGDSYNNYINNLNKNILRAISPFQVSDKATLDHIRKYEGIDSGDSFHNIGIAGGIIGAGVAATVVASSLYAAALSQAAIGTMQVAGGIAATSSGAGAVVGIPAIVKGAVTIVSAVGTIMMGYTLGKTIAQGTLTPEGRHFMGRYLGNLGSSMVARPITTVLNLGAIVTMEIAKRKIPIISSLPNVVTTLSFMALNQGANALGGYIDNQLLGSITEYQAISYTTIGAIRGDLLDMQDGNPILRGAILGITDPDKVVEKIASAYGLTDEYDDFLAGDLRNNWGIDLGHFGNSVVDMVAEVMVDTSFIGNAAQNSLANKIGLGKQAELYDYIRENPDSEIGRLVLTKTKNKEFEDGEIKIEQELERIRTADEVNQPKTPEEFKNKSNEVLSKFTVNELKTLASELGVKTKSRMRKQEIIDEISKTNSEEVVKRNRDSEEEKLRQQKKEELRKVLPVEWDYKDSELGSRLQKNKRIQRLFQEYYKDYIPETAARNEKQLKKIQASNEKLIMQLVSNFQIGIGSYNPLLNLELRDFLKRDQIIMEVKNKKLEISKDTNFVIKDLGTKKDNSYFKHKGYSFDSAIANTAIEKGFKASQLLNERFLNRFSSYRFMNETNDKITKYTTTLVDLPRTFMRKFLQSKSNKLQRMVSSNDKREMEITLERLKQLGINSKEYKREVALLKKAYQESLEASRVKVEELIQNDDILNLRTKIDEINVKIKELEKDLDEEKNKPEMEKFKKELETLVENYETERKKRFAYLYTNDSDFRDFYDIYKREQDRIVALEEETKRYKNINVKVKYNYVVKTEEGLFKNIKSINKDNVKDVEKLMDDLTIKKETSGLNGKEELELKELQSKYFKYKMAEEFSDQKVEVANRLYNIQVLSSEREITFSRAIYTIRSQTRKILMYSNNSLINNLTIDNYKEVVEYQRLRAQESKTPEEVNRMNILKTSIGEEAIKEIDNIDDDVKKLLEKTSNKKLEFTQDDIIENAEEQARIFGSRGILSVAAEDQIKGQLIGILGPELGGKIEKTIRENGNVKLELNFAVEFLSAINPLVFGDKDSSARFVMNDYEFARFLEPRVKENKVISNSLDILGRIIKKIENPIGGKSQYSYSDTKKVSEHIQILEQELNKILYEAGIEKDPYGKPLLTQKEIENIQTNIKSLVYSLVGTHKTMKYSGTDFGTRQKKISQLTGAELNHWLHKEFLENDEEHKKVSEQINTELRLLNQSLVSLKDSFDANDSAIGKYVPEEMRTAFLRSHTYNIFGSKFLSGLSYEFTKTNIFKDFTGKKIRAYETKAIPLDQNIIDESNKNFENADLELKKGTKEEFRNELIREAFKFNSVENTKALGFTEEDILNKFNENLKEIKDIEDTKKTMEFFGNSVIEILENEIKNKDTTEERKIELESEIKEFKKTVAEYEEMLLKKENTDQIFKQVQMAEEKDAPSKDDSPLFKWLKMSDISKRVIISNMHNIVRGDAVKISGHISFDFTNSTSKEVVEKFFAENEVPTIEAIEKLMDQKNFTFVNGSGSTVRITSLSQLQRSGILVGTIWEKYLTDDKIIEVKVELEKDNEGNEIKKYIPQKNDKGEYIYMDIASRDSNDNLIITEEEFSFYKGIGIEKLKEDKVLFESMVDSSYRVPAQIREIIYNKEMLKKQTGLEEVEFKNFSNKDLKITSGTIVDDFYKGMLKEITSVYSDAKIKVSGVINIKIKDFDNKFRVVRVFINEKEYFDMYIPEAEEINLSKDGEFQLGNVYQTMGQRYAKVDRISEPSENGDYVKYLVDSLMFDIKVNYARHKELGIKEPFQPALSQKNMYNIFFDQRFSESGLDNELVTDFIRIDDQSGIYQELLLGNQSRINNSYSDISKKDSEHFEELILREKVTYGDKEYSVYDLRSTTQNPKSVFKTVEGIVSINPDGTEVIGRFSLNDLVLPFNLNQGVASRSSIPLNAIKMQKRLYKRDKEGKIINNEELKEEALVQTNLQKNNNKKFGNHLNGGINLDTVLYDYNYNSVTTYEDGSVMPASAALKYFGIPIGSSGFKIVNRHSGKQSVRIVPDEEFRKGLNLKDGETTPDIVISKSSVKKRKLTNIVSELALTQGITRNEDGSFNGDIKYVDNHKSLSENGVVLNKEITRGFMYSYLTDLVDFGPEGEGYKTAGADGKNGAVFGVQEIITISGLGNIRDENGESLDPDGILFEHFMKISKSNYKGIEKYLNEDINSTDLTGKPGLIKRDLLRRQLPHSGYNVILPDSGLKNNEMKIPISQAIKAQILVKDPQGMYTYNGESYSFVDDSAKQGVVLRYPTTGRRSMIHINFVIDESENKAAFLSLGLHKLLNADHDGDRVAFLSHANANDHILKLSRKAFGHNYDTKGSPTPFSDNAFQGEGFEQEVSTLRDPDEVFAEDAGMKRYIDEEGITRFRYTEDENENYSKFIEDGNNNIIEEEEARQSFSKQKNLKEYAGLITGLVDSQLMMYEQNNEGRNWFKHLMSKSSEDESYKKLVEMGITDFPSLGAYLKDTYSQLTFDFLKHGKEEQRISFQTLVEAAKRDPQRLETFEMHIRRLIDVAYLDFLAMKDLKSSVENIDSKLSEKEKLELEKEYLKKYQQRLDQGRMNVEKDSTEESVHEKHKKIAQKYKDTLSKEQAKKILDETEGSKTLNKNNTEAETKEDDIKKRMEDFKNKNNIDVDQLLKDASEKSRTTETFKHINNVGYDMDWNVGSEYEGKQIFRFLADNVGLSVKKIGRERLDGTELNILSKKIKKALFNMFDSIGNISQNIHRYYFTTIINGKITRVPLASLFEVKIDGKFVKLSNKNFGSNLDITNRNHSQIYVDVVNGMRLFEEGLETFFIETTPDSTGYYALDPDTNQKHNEKLFFEIDNAVTDLLEKIGIDRRAVTTPALHGAFSFKKGVFKNLMIGLNRLNDSDYETVSPSVIAIKSLYNINEKYKQSKEQSELDKANEEIDIMIEELMSSLTPHFAYQVFSEMLDPSDPNNPLSSKINNVKRLIFEQGLFAEPESEVRYENDNDIREALNRYKLLKTMNIKELANSFMTITTKFYKEKFKLDKDDRSEKDVLNQLIAIAEQIHRATSVKDGYGAHNHFFEYNDFETILRYITQLQNIKWGAMSGKNTDYNFDENRLKSISNSSSIEQVDDRLINLHLNKLSGMFNNLSITRGRDISNSIEAERMNFIEISQAIKELNGKLRRYNTNTELLNNKVIETDGVIEKAASFLGYNNMDDNRIFIKSSKEENTVKQIVQELHESIFIKRDIEGPQSELSRELFQISRMDPKIRENILALYTLTSNRDGTSNDLRTYIQRLENELSNRATLFEGLPINKKLLEYVLKLNKLLLTIDPNASPILPDTIKTIRNDLNRDVSFGDFLVDEVTKTTLIDHKNISNHNIYATYFRGLIISKEGQLGFEEIIAAKDALYQLLSTDQSFNTGNLNGSDFIDVIFGKLLYDQEVARINTNEKSIDKRIENSKKFIGSIIKLIREIEDSESNKLFKDSMQITSEIIDLSIDSKEDEINDLIIKYLQNGDPDKEVSSKDIEIVKRGLKKYHSEKKRQITEKQKSNVADSMSAVDDFRFGPDGPKIITKGLRNIHHQLAEWFKSQGIDLKIDTDRNSEALALKIAAKYKIELEEQGLEINNERFHDAMIDVLINHEVIIMLSEYAKLNPNALDNYDLKNSKESKKIKKFYQDYSDPTKRKNMIVFDNETLVLDARNKDVTNNKVYQIAYLSFDENGVPKYNQKFIFTVLDQPTKDWLKVKGFNDTQIEKIENEMKVDLGWNQRRNIVEGFLKELKGKQIFGQNVKGDIEQINNEHEKLIKKDVSDILLELKIDNDDIIKAIPTANASELKTLYENYLKHDFKNDSKFVHSFLKAMSDSMIQRFKTEYMYGSQVSYSQREKNAYSAKMEALLNVFSNSLLDNQDLIVQMRNVLTKFFDSNAIIDDDVLIKIIDKFKEKYNQLKTSGSFVFEIPEIGIDDEYGTIQFKSLEGQGILRIEDDNSLFSEVMFRQQALYSIMPLLKEQIIYAGMSYTQHEQLAYNKKLLKTENNKLANDLRNSENERVRKHLENYESNIISNPVEALMDIKKALSLHKKDTNIKLWGLERFMTSENDKIDTEILNFIDGKMRLDDKESVKKVLNTSQKDIEKVINLYINHIISNQFGDDPDKNNRYSKFYETSWNFYKAGSKLISIGPDGSPNADRVSFDQLLGLDSTTNKDLSDELFNKFINNYQRFVTTGLPFKTRTNNLMELVSHSNEADRVFIQMAFTAIAGDKSGIGKYLHKHLNDNFSFENNEFGEYEERDIYRKEQREAADRLFESIQTLVKNTTLENDFNKTYFTNERFNLKNKILKGLFHNDWSELESYLRASPKFRDNPDKEIQEFKNLFINKYNSLVQNGIPIYEENIYIDKSGTLQYNKPTEKIMHFIQGNDSVKMAFIKEAMKELWLEIDDELYINKHRSSSNLENDTNEKLLRSEYIKNINDYGGYRIKSSLALEQKNNKILVNGNALLSERKNRIDQLSKYQRNFFDIMDMFRNKKGVLNKEAFFEAYKKGFLGRTYRITAITELSRKDLNDSPDSFKNEENYGLYKNDQEVLDSFGPAGQELLNKLEQSASPIIKTLNIETFEEFEDLIKIAESGEFLGLGFSSLPELIQANRISYKDYELPKALAKIERTLVRMQKFLATTSPSFFIKMIYDDLAKNYNAILGNDSPLYNNYRFAKEGIKAMQLGSHYIAFNKDIKSAMIMFESFFKDFTKLTNENYSSDNFKAHKEFMDNFLLDKISNIKLFKENFIKDDVKSKLYKEVSEIENKFTLIKMALDTLESNTNFDSVFLQVKSIAVDLFKTYHYSNFTSKVIMNSHKDSSIDIARTNLTQDEKFEVLDTISLVGLINTAEQSKLFYTPYELNGGMEAYDISKIIEGIAKEVVSNGWIADFVDWAVFDSPIGSPRKKLLNLITRHSTIHGLLLDRYINHMSDDEAIASGLHRFFNYNMQSPFEKEAAILFPFIGFAIRNLDYQMELMTDPKHIRFMSNLHQGMQSFYRRDDEDDETQSNWYHMMVENQGWIPMGKDWGIKLGNPMHQSINLVDNPYEGLQMYQNSLITGIQSVIQGNGFDPSWHGSMGAIISGAKGINNIVTGQVNRPSDILPGLFYTERPSKKFTPRNYRVNYDYRNLNRQLFFTDGSRRTPSKNPYTTAKNIRYQALVNASINRRRR